MQNYPTDITITKIEQVTVEIDQPAIGCNSGAKEIKQPDPNGKWRERIVRIHTNDGTLGWGVGSWGTASAEDAEGILNQNPFELLNPEDGVVGRIPRGLKTHSGTLLVRYSGNLPINSWAAMFFQTGYPLTIVRSTSTTSSMRRKPKVSNGLKTMSKAASLMGLPHAR